nr:DUF4397 domain-containing protein [Salisediminibacterium beveridgei]
MELSLKKWLMSSLAMLLMLSMFAGTAFADNHGDDNAMVRILHASPDAPAVDIYVNGDLTVEDAAFKDITGYLELPAGEYDIAIHAAGDDEAVYEQSLAVDGGVHYTVAAVDFLDGGDFRLEAFADDNTVDEGMTKVRVGHMSPDAPAVDVGLVGGDSLFEGAEFFAVTDYLELDPDTYDLEIRAAGTEDAVLDLSGTTLEADTVYSVYAVGALDDLEVVVVADEAHAMPGDMPQTGMGGASQSSTMLPLYLSLFAGAAVMFVLIRRRYAFQG